MTVVGGLVRRRVGRLVGDRRFGTGLLLLFVAGGIHAVVAAATSHEWRLEEEARRRTHQEYVGAAQTLIEFAPCLEVASNVLASLDHGISREFPTTIIVGGWYFGPCFLSARVQDNPFLVYTTHADVGHLVQVVLALLVIVIAHDVVVQERVRGTLRLLLSVGVSPLKYVFAQYCALMLVLVLSTSVVFLEWCGVMVAMDGGLAWRDVQWVAAVIVLTTLFVSFFVLLSLAVSIAVSQVAESLITLVVVWVLVVVVIPTALGALGPLPGQGESDREVVWGRVPGEQEAVVEPGRFASVRTSGPWPQRRYPDQFEEALRRTAEIPNVLDRFRLARLWGYLSPATQFSWGIAELAGTDVEAYAYLWRRAVDADVRLRQWQEMAIPSNPRRGRMVTSEDEPLDTSTAPGSATINVAEGRDVVEACARSLLPMALWNVLGAGAVLGALARRRSWV